MARDDSVIDDDWNGEPPVDDGKYCLRASAGDHMECVANGGRGVDVPGKTRAVCDAVRVASGADPAYNDDELVMDESFAFKGEHRKADEFVASEAVKHISEVSCDEVTKDAAECEMTAASSNMCARLSATRRMLILQHVMTTHRA